MMNNQQNQALASAGAQGGGISAADYLARMKQKEIHTSGSMIMTVNDTLRVARRKPQAEDLWNGMVFERECTVIFSDSNVGKSILAVQIGVSIAKSGRNVLYMDYEMSDLQFAARYTNPYNKQFYHFPDNFFRAEQQADALQVDPIENIKECIGAVAADVVIIDNITWLANETESGDVAGRLMMELIQLKRKAGLTLIIIAHTPKRPLGQILTQNDLGGSKKIMNFVDCAIGLAKCVFKPEMRYLKNIKNRSASIVYGSNHVWLCELVTTENFCHFAFTGTADELQVLKPYDAKREQLEADVKRMHNQGHTQRFIAQQLGVGLATVNRILNG